MIAVDLNIPDEAKGLSGEKLPRIVQLPVRWVQFQLVQAGSNAMLEEKLLDEKDAGAVYWDKRQFGLFDFRRVNNLDSANANSIRLRRLEVTDDYISFVIANSEDNADSQTSDSEDGKESQKGIAIHYSFARDASKIQGQIYPSLDRKMFGFWRHIRKFYPGQLTVSEKNVEQNISLGRMYPKDNKIEVYLTDNTPSDPGFISAIQGAIDAWDEAFVEAARGSKWEKNPIRVSLNTEKRVKAGDVRYSKISFYDFNINVGGLLGYGPSVTDDRTGQIYSSTNDIYLRTYREGIYADLKNYVKSKLGLYNGKAVQGVDYPNQFLKSVGNQNTDFGQLIAAAPNTFVNDIGVASQSNSATADETPLAKLGFATDFAGTVKLAKDLLAMPERERLRSMVPEKFRAAIDQRVKKASEFGNQSSKCDYHAAVANTFDQIEKTCGELRFGSYVKELVENSKDLNLEELNFPAEIFNECAMKLLQPTLRSTLVHEFGHNLGLTHNFKGSADNNNFATDENGLPVSRSTSVMDYPDHDEDRATKPGPYDVAAIRYGYYHMVELNERDEDGKVKVVSIDSAKENDTSPIAKRVEDPSKVRVYQYCWDLDILMDYEIPNSDPSCRRWDRGSNPVQMAYAFIDRFNYLTTTKLTRFENFNLGNPSDYVWEQSILPLQSLYTKYRHLLHLKTKGLNDPYFVKNEQNFDKMIETYVGKTKVEDLPKDSVELEKFVEKLPELEQYKLAADISFKFLKQVAFAEDLYCSVWDTSNNDRKFLRAVPFAKVRSSVFNDTREIGGRTINSCNEARAFLAKAVNLDEQHVDVSSSGNLFKTIPYSADDAELRLEEIWSRNFSDMDALPILGKDAVARGLGEIRNYAFLALTYRFPALLTAEQNNFLPSMMDDPNYRRDLLKEFETRIANGVDKTKFGVALSSLNQSDRYSTQYSEEKDYLETMYPLLLLSAMSTGENAIDRIKELQPDVYNRADFVRIFPNPETTENLAYIQDADGTYYVSEKPDTAIFRILKRLKTINSQLSDTVQLDLFIREKDKLLQSVNRTQAAFFDELNKTPELDLNLIKLSVVYEAQQYFVNLYLGAGTGEPVLDAEVTNGATTNAGDAVANNGEATSNGNGSTNPTGPTSPSKFESVNNLIAQAKPYLDYAKALGGELTEDNIYAILLEVAGATDSAPDFLDVLFSVVKPDDEKYLGVAYNVIMAKISAGITQKTPRDALICSKVYDAYIAKKELNRLSKDEFAEKGAQQSLLRSIILR